MTNITVVLGFGWVALIMGYTPTVEGSVGWWAIFAYAAIADLLKGKKHD